MKFSVHITHVGDFVDRSIFLHHLFSPVASLVILFYPCESQKSSHTDVF